MLIYKIFAIPNFDGDAAIARKADIKHAVAKRPSSPETWIQTNITIFH